MTIFVGLEMTFDGYFLLRLLEQSPLSDPYCIFGLVSVQIGAARVFERNFAI